MVNLLPLALIAVVAAASFLAVFLVIRGLLDRRRERWRQRVAELEDDSPPLLAELTGKQATDWAGRMDQSFKQMIQRTGLGWSAEQALGLMALTGIALAAALT